MVAHFVMRRTIAIKVSLLMSLIVGLFILRKRRYARDCGDRGKRISIEIQSKAVVDAGLLYDKLAPYITDQISRDDFVAKIVPGTNQYRVVARKLIKAQADAVTALEEPGAVIKVDKWRFYPGEFLAAHVLGFLGFSDKGQNGRYGLERSYEVALSHTAESLYVNFLQKYLPI